MNSDDRTFSLSEIHERQREAERQAALMQRRAEALRKLAEAAEELEQAEREMASPDAKPVAEVVPEPTASPEPGTTGGRALLILRERAGERMNPREMKDEMVARGWAEDTEDARAAIRVSLTRLARRDPHVERVESGPTHAYRWTPNGRASVGDRAHGDDGRAHATSGRTEP